MIFAQLNRILRLCRPRIKSPVLDEATLKVREQEAYGKYSWDFNSAVKNLNTIRRSFELEEYRNDQDLPREQILFSAISNHHQVNRILEIGTATGRSTFMLSQLFPDSKILTIDLPETDSVFLDYAGMKGNTQKLAEFNQTQVRNIREKNIEFVRCNSFLLPAITDETFDLIWVDGGHFFPEVSWDICNAFHYCNIGGHIIIDDVSEPREGKISDKVSSDPRKMLEYLKCRLGIDVDFFLKRTDRRSLSDPAKLKYLGVIRKREFI